MKRPYHVWYFVWKHRNGEALAPLVFAKVACWVMGTSKYPNRKYEVMAEEGLAYGYRDVRLKSTQNG